jgi:hypothetical protein
MIKALKKLGLERVNLNIIKAAYDKLIANIILNGKKLKTLPLKSGTKHRCSLSPQLFKTLFEFLARAIRQQKEIQIISYLYLCNFLFLFVQEIK